MNLPRFLQSELLLGNDGSKFFCREFTAEVLAIRKVSRPSASRNIYKVLINLHS